MMLVVIIPKYNEFQEETSAKNSGIVSSGAGFSKKTILFYNFLQQ